MKSRSVAKVCRLHPLEYMNVQICIKCFFFTDVSVWTTLFICRGTQPGLKSLWLDSLFWSKQEESIIEQPFSRQQCNPTIVCCMFCVKGEAIIIHTAQCSETGRLPCLHPRTNTHLWLKATSSRPLAVAVCNSGKQEITVESEADMWDMFRGTLHKRKKKKEKTK